MLPTDSNSSQRPMFATAGLVLMMLAVPVGQIGARLFATTDEYAVTVTAAPAFTGAGLCLLAAIVLCGVGIQRKEQPHWYPMLIILVSTCVIAYVAFASFG